MSRLEEYAHDVLAGLDMVIVDVGAAYGLPRHLAVLENVARVCLFEPHEARAQELQRYYIEDRGLANVTVFTDALAGSEGQRTLYVTNVPTGSSLLKPGGAFMSDFGDPAYFYPLTEVEVHTRRLADVLAGASISRADAIKLDVQGAELEVLQGLGSGLSQDTLSVELEIGFPGAYVDQPGYGQISDFMDTAEFQLYDLRIASHHRSLGGDRTRYPVSVFGVSPDSPSLTKRIAEADALFFKRPDFLLARRDANSIRRLVVLMCVYGYFIEALDLIRRARDAKILEESSALACHKAVIGWHRITRDLITDSTWFVSFATLVRRCYRVLQRRILGKHVSRWRE